jgi:hypothetical protein
LWWPWEVGRYGEIKAEMQAREVEEVVIGGADNKRESQRVG